MKAKEAWHCNMKETRTEKPTLGKNGIQSHASRLVGGYHNGLVQALGHKEWNVLGSMGEGLERASEQQASLGELPQVYKSGEQVRHSELVGAVSRDSDKYIAQLPQGLEKGWELALPLTGAIPWKRLRGEPPKIPFQGVGRLQSHKAA